MSDCLRWGQAAGGLRFPSTVQLTRELPLRSASREWSIFDRMAAGRRQGADMKKLAELLCGLAMVMLLLFPAGAQPYNVISFGCVADISCHGGSLEGYVPSSVMPVGTIVSVAGYYSAADSGGGSYVVLGQQSAVCSGYMTSTSASGMVGSTTITFSSDYPTDLTIGELVSGSGTNIQVQAGSEIASISYDHLGNLIQITITLPLTGTAAGTTNINLTISGSNGGTLILDSYSGSNAHDCYEKTNYRGEPHEWGAYGDGTDDDTAALQYWLGAYGAAVTTSTGAAPNPSNFGPWIATIPATYIVSQPLVCPTYAVLTGSANNTAANSSGSTNGSPTVTIMAAPWSDGAPVFKAAANQPLPALMMASDYCRISGIALDANVSGDKYASNPMSSTTSSSNTVQLGSAPATFIVPGTPVSDTGGCIPSGALVTGVNTSTYTLTLSVNASATACTDDTVITTGFYTLDVVGTHVAVDSHSLLKNGYWNLYCGSVYEQGLEVKDSQIVKSYDDGIHVPNCDNVRLTGDNLQSAGSDLGPDVTGVNGAGIYFGGNDLTLADGIVQQAGGPGVLLSGAKHVGITSMIFNTNGQYVPATSPNIDIEPPQGGGYSTQDTTICNNRIDTAANDATNSAQIRLGGTIDNLTFCGNTYQSGSGNNDANVTPWYVYDVSSASPPTLTNTHLYETPAQPPVSVFSPAAQPVLASLAVPQFTQNQIGGLIMSNNLSSPYTELEIAPGSAADSTNATVIQLAQTCTINLNTNGPGGIDNGSTVQPDTTYNIFLIAAAASGMGGVATPNCIASTSSVPLFKQDYFSGSGYFVGATGGTLSTGSTVYNVSPLAGVAVGNVLQPTTSDGLSGAAITAFSANLGPAPGVTASWSTPTAVIKLSSTTNVMEGMAIVDVDNCIPANTYILSNTVPSYVTLSNTISSSSDCTSSMGDPVSISGVRQLVLNSSAATTHAHAEIDIGIGYYRLIGAVFTDSASHIVQFLQDNDTFSLRTPGNDINTSTLSTTATAFQLASVPSGTPVEAFGRCVASQKVRLFTPGGTPVLPSSFPTVPGYDTLGAINAYTSFPYRLYTNSTGAIDAQSGTTGTMLYCMTDGWVFNR
jgi:hypothetical protein